MIKHKFYSSQISSKGFTIVELLIVIVVIGILAALVLNALSGAQAKARDAERASDIRVLASQLEVWYQLNGYYPSNAKWIQNEGSGTYSQANAEAWAQTNFPGIDVNALRSPGNASQTITQIVNVSTQLPVSYDKDKYYYSPLNSGGTACSAVGTKCIGFNLYYGTETDQAEHTKASLNNS